MVEEFAPEIADLDLREGDAPATVRGMFPPDQVVEPGGKSGFPVGRTDAVVVEDGPKEVFCPGTIRKEVPGGGEEGAVDIKDDSLDAGETG